MKSLIPWMCLVMATSQQVFADDDYHAYRMGNYNKASEPLWNMSGKDPVADYYLGRLFLYGYGHLKNNELAIRYFTKSADKGYLPAVQLMAKYCLFQIKNPEQALKWFKQAAAAGDVNAQMYVAAAYLFGVGVKPNSDVATKYYIDAARNGNALAQYALANSFLNSKHSTNNKLGLIWLSKSAAAGNLQAMTQLGSIYVEGKLIPKDMEKGLDLLNKAAAQNFSPAMVELGQAALISSDYTQAIAWFNKAINLKNNEAYLDLAHAYLQDKSPIYDANAGFLWTLKAAQNGVLEAKSELANLYQKGIGVAANQELATQWANQAKEDAKNKNKTSSLAQAALWLSGNTTDQLDQTIYRMNSILSSWQNPAVIRDNSYNQPPRLEQVSRQDIFKPQFTLTQPNEVPIDNYYDALVNLTAAAQDNQWTYPIYPLNRDIAAIEKANSPVLARRDLHAPYADADYYNYDDYSNAQLIDIWTPGWQQQANYMAVFNQLYFKALLGDAQSQFEIGQMFQYGLGVGRNDQSAIIFYQNAAQQQHLGAEYNLGLLAIQRPQAETDYQQGVNWLTDSAFKGNKRSQYVLAKLLSQGKKGPDGKDYIVANPEQAQSMLYLAAANNYGPAEYELAENLARSFNSGLSVQVKKQKLALIRQLYTGAAHKGVLQALLPLAFFNAMDADPQKQKAAFAVAEEQAQTGDEKAALLLGLLYDRGIGTAVDPEKAIQWYKQSGQNPVSQFILGTYTTEGKGVSEDKEKGMDLLNQAAAAHFGYADFNLAVLKKQSGSDFLTNLVSAYSLGNSHAGIVLADYYLSHDNDAQKMEDAKQIYVGLAEKGDQYAQLKLAYMLDNGLGAPQDLVGAQRWYIASAEQGNALGQFLLAQFYQAGESSAPDYQLAKEWYQKAAGQLPQAAVDLGFIDETVEDNYKDALAAYQLAAEKGDQVGTYNLALMYFYGKGVAVDYQKAKTLFAEAAKHGNSDAMTQLANIYFNALGVPRDVQQGLALYQKAADLGNAAALFELGLFSETGANSKPNYAEAVKYYQDSADKGNERAMLALARMYHHGLGVPKDLKISADYYQKLADRQNAYAQYKLGTFYLEGIAGEQSVDKGKQLLKQASDNGNLEARQVLEKMNAQVQARLNAKQPVIDNFAPFVIGRTANLIYSQANILLNHADDAWG
ncbi:MAG: endopeptidase IV [Legionella sp.]|nr:MAG: endopeptidase IV [Legionella sp.]